MKITLTRSETDFFQVAAWRLIAQILMKHDAMIGLSTGRTTQGIYAAVCDIHRQYSLDVSGLTVFNVDEVTNVPREYSGSCYTLILNQLVKPLGIPAEHFIMPPTISDDFETECQLFEKRLAEHGSIDLMMLGIGENGHIGFNQPGTPFERETWHSRLDSALEERIRRETQVSSDVRLGGITLGIKNVMHSRKIVLVANGPHKASIIAATLQGPVTPEVPASVLQLHPDCEVILDPAAARHILSNS